MQSPAERIRLIERSLRCFVLGWLSLIPFVGLVTAAFAVALHFKTSADSGTEWNPARRYLLAGYFLAWVGILITVGGSGLVLAIVINRSGF